ncbi:MAG: hypothetical protein WBG42_03540 [Cryomorphaceae bacterium]
MKGRYKYILFFLTFIPLISFGQNDEMEEQDFYSLDSVYTIRNAIKVDPVQIIYGDYSLYFEHMLTGRYSVEVGVGFTRRNYAAGWFDYELDNLGRNVDIKTGPSVSLSFRRYFQDYEELGGAYLAVGVNYRRHQKDFGVIDTAGVLTDISYTDDRQTVSTIFKFGYQALSLNSNVFVDIYTGPAIRFKNYDIVRTTSINDPNAYSIENLNEVVFGWELGIRVGFGF